MPHVGELQLKPTEQAFIAPTLLNSWTNFGGGYNTAGYYKDQLGFVHLKGMLTGGVLNTAAFTLPVGFRPAARNIYPAMANFLFAVAFVDTNGDVNLFQGSNAFFSIDGITFKAA
jgi:transcription termination factor Rho